MDSQTAAEKNSVINKVNRNLQVFWSNLSENQQSILKKIWSILTYKWQWQIILNAPFLIISKSINTCLAIRLAYFLS